LLIEAAVKGFGAGLVSVALMALFELPFWRARGMEGVVEWQVNQILVSKVLRQGYDPSMRLPLALASHFLHGVVAGGVLAIILAAFLLQFAFYFLLVGLLFSLFLWSLVPLTFRRALESAGRVQFSRGGMLVSLASHMVYGLVLGALLQALLP
jgi:hypothetical protein